MNEKASRGVYREFSWMSFLWRLAASMVLVLATYNPTRLSYYNWLSTSMSERALGPEHFVVGIVLVIGWTVLGVASKRSLGPIGLLLAAALIGGIVWWLTDMRWIAVGSVSALSWVSLICLSILLAVGLSWAHIWRRVTGQYEVDDNDG